MFLTGVWNLYLDLGDGHWSLNKLWNLALALVYGFGFDICSVESRKYVVSGDRFGWVGFAKANQFQ